MLGSVPSQASSPVQKVESSLQTKPEGAVVVGGAFGFGVGRGVGDFVGAFVGPVVGGFDGADEVDGAEDNEG